MKKLLFTLLFGSSLLLRADNIAKKLSVCTNEKISNLEESSLNPNEKSYKQNDSFLKNAFLSSRTARIVNTVNFAGFLAVSGITLGFLGGLPYSNFADNLNLDDWEKKVKLLLAVSAGAFYAAPSLAVIVNPECKQEDSGNGMSGFIIRGIFNASMTTVSMAVLGHGHLLISGFLSYDCN